MQTYYWIKFIDDSKWSSPCVGYWRLSCSSVLRWCLLEGGDLLLTHVPEFTYMVDLWFCINCCICWCMWVIAMIKHGTSNIKFRYYTAHARLCYVRLVQQNVAQRLLGPGKVIIIFLMLTAFLSSDHWTLVPKMPLVNVPSYSFNLAVDNLINTVVLLLRWYKDHASVLHTITLSYTDYLLFLKYKYFLSYTNYMRLRCLQIAFFFDPLTPYLPRIKRNIYTLRTWVDCGYRMISVMFLLNTW